MTVSEQGRVFLGMMLAGVGIGMAYDLLGVLRRGPMMTACADLMLGVAGAACIIGAGLRLSCDPMRLYVFCGSALGWTAYACSAGAIVRSMAKKCIGLSKK